MNLTPARKKLLQAVAEGRVHLYVPGRWTYCDPAPGEHGGKRTVKGALAALLAARLVRHGGSAHMTITYTLTDAGRVALYGNGEGNE